MSPSRRLVRALLAAAVLVPSAGLIAAPAQGCTPRPVAGLGMACPAPEGWRVLLRDGTWLPTHGGDTAPDGRLAAAVSAVDAVAPSCVVDDGAEAHGLAIYARAVDGPDRAGTMADEIRTMIMLANGMLEQESAELGRSLDYRMACDAGQVRVVAVTLPTPMQQTTFSTVVGDLRARGFMSPLAKYWIWFDGRPPGAPGGTGSIEGDDAAAANNRSNFGPGYGVTWGFAGGGGAFIMMHENAHNLGAVQNSALHASGGFHCNDGRDVMCYADGGPRSNYSPEVCATLHFDCGHDDYFHPAVPDAEHLLANAWNLGSPLNRFVSGCTYATGALALGAPGLEAAGVHDVPGGCGGRLYAAMGFLPSVPAGGAPVVTQAPNSFSLPDVDVCWYAGATLIRCDTGRGAQRGTVPADATSARVVLVAGAAADYVLSII